MKIIETESVSQEDFSTLAQQLTHCQILWTLVWHQAESNPPSTSLLDLVQEEHRRNFELWHEEDKAREPHVSDALIAAVKRSIDRLNQQRNDLIEKLDEFLLAELNRRKVIPDTCADFNSETPGSIIDRLSILSLKIYHMREQTERLDATREHILKCNDRLKVLLLQHSDLTAAFQKLCDALFSGKKQMKIYRQFKMYNDPDSNPAIYRKIN